MRLTDFFIVLTVAVLLAGCAGAAAPTSRPSAPAARTAAPITPAAAASTSARRTRWIEMFARGYFPGRSGQIFVIPAEGEVITDREPLYRFMHGSPWDYDTHIPVLLHGRPFIRQGEWHDPVVQQDVAPTLGAILGAGLVPTYTGSSPI